MFRVLLALTFAAPLGTSAVEIKEAYTRYMEAGQFQFLREFFTGEEYSGNRVILRTDPAQREGRYFVLTLDAGLRTLPAGTELVLEVIADDAIPVETFHFPLTAHTTAKKSHVLLGLTSAPWLTFERDPLAWRIRLVHGEQTEAEWTSFLWQMP